MGLAFAEHFVDFVGNHKQLPVKSITKVESNPDQSKHLETAKTKVLDTELDFVNLRSEEYAGDSRIPTEVVNTTHSCGYDHVINMIMEYKDFWHTPPRCIAARYHH